MPPHRLSAHPLSRNAYAWAAEPPTALELDATIEILRVPKVLYQQPYYSNPKDVPKDARGIEYGGRAYTIKGDTIQHTLPFHHHVYVEVVDPKFPSNALERRLATHQWEWAAIPPLWKDAQAWLDAESSCWTLSLQANFNTLDSLLSSHSGLRSETARCSRSSDRGSNAGAQIHSGQGRPISPREAAHVAPHDGTPGSVFLSHNCR